MTGGYGQRVGSGQIDFIVPTDKIMMANRNCDYKVARSWDLPNEKGKLGECVTLTVDITHYYRIRFSLNTSI